MARRRASVLFNLIVFAVGLVGLVVLLDRLGWEGVQAALAEAGLWFVAFAAIDLASMFCDSAGIYAFLRPKAPVSFWRVFAAEASGLAINRLTPGNSLGEPTKVTMLVAHVPRDYAVSAIVMFNLATYYIAITALVIGVPLTALMLDLPDRVAIVAWIAVGVLATGAIVIAIVIRRGAVATMIGGIARIKLISSARAERWTSRVTGIDTHIRELGKSPRGIIAIAGSRLLNWTGTIAILHALAIPLTAPVVVGALSVGMLVTWISNIVPLGLGIADGGNYLLYGLLGAPPSAGLAFAMVNRARTCVLAIMGLTVMAIANTFVRNATTADH